MADIGSQWEKLRAARAQRDDTPAPPAATDQADVDSPAARALAETATVHRDAAGKFAKAPDETPPAAVTPPVETPPAAPPAAAASETPPAAPKPDDARPQSVEIELDGVRVAVDPSLAAAIEKADKVKKGLAAESDRETLKAELREELKKELTPAAPSADELADRALQEAEKSLAAMKRPDSQLLVTDPDEYNRQMDLYLEQREKVAEARTEAKLTKVNRDRATSTQQATEAEARAVLNEQFYRAYPALRDSKRFVDTILDEKFAEVLASGKLAKPLTPPERETLKDEAFADVAAKATREVVRLTGAAKRIAPPTPPPALAASAPARPAPATPPTPKEEVRTKYPKGSISALMHERRSSRDRATA